MLRRLLILLILFAGVSVAGGIYKWVDEHGITVYSEMPPSGKNAKQVKLPPQPTKEVSEPWGFKFDSNAWQVGYQATDSQRAIREYVLQGETVDNWTKLVTSLYLNVDSSLKEYFQRLTEKGAEGCSSMKFSVIDDTKDMLIFEWGHDGCHGYPPQHEIQRISSSPPGILSLTFAEKGALSIENRKTWLSILRNAVVINSLEHEKQRRSQQQNLSLSLDDLGPLPKNESSKFVETSGTGVLIDSVKLAGGFYISLLAKYSLPYGAYLETNFEDPENPNNQIVVGQERRGDEQTINIFSPKSKGLKCRNYEVTVKIYADKSKSKFLGYHQQRIQSKINLDKVKTAEVLFEVMSSGNCP